MRAPSKPPEGGLLGGIGADAALKELTIALGRSDLYVNLGKPVERPDGDTLFEAILTDDKGSRAIYVNMDDIAQCLRESFVLGGTKRADTEGA